MNNDVHSPAHKVLMSTFRSKRIALTGSGQLRANSGSTRKLTHENANDVHLNGFNHRQLPLLAQSGPYVRTLNTLLLYLLHPAIRLLRSDPTSPEIGFTCEEKDIAAPVAVNTDYYCR